MIRMFRQMPVEIIAFHFTKERIIFGYGFDMDIPSPYIVRVVYRFLLK